MDCYEMSAFVQINNQLQELRKKYALLLKKEQVLLLDNQQFKRQLQNQVQLLHQFQIQSQSAVFFNNLSNDSTQSCTQSLIRGMQQQIQIYKKQSLSRLTQIKELKIVVSRLKAKLSQQQVQKNRIKQSSDQIQRNFNQVKSKFIIQIQQIDRLNRQNSILKQKCRNSQLSKNKQLQGTVKCIQMAYNQKESFINMDIFPIFNQIVQKYQQTRLTKDNELVVFAKGLKSVLTQLQKSKCQNERLKGIIKQYKGTLSRLQKDYQYIWRESKQSSIISQDYLFERERLCSQLQIYKSRLITYHNQNTKLRLSQQQAINRYKVIVQQIREAL